MNKKNDHIISTALRDTKAYDSYFNKLNQFLQTFNFLTLKEGDLNCSQQIMLRTKQTHHTRNINSLNTITQLIYHHETHNIDFNLLTPNTLHHSSKTSHIVLKTLTCKESLETTTLSDNCIYFAH